MSTVHVLVFVDWWLNFKF